VVDHSFMIENLLNGVGSDLRFEMNDNVYFWYCFLVEGVYP
jgi:hypothetical protein